MIKRKAKGTWLRRGLNPEDFEKAWTAHCNSTNCEWCNNKYKSSRDKNMDHCHEADDYYKKGAFRNILCHKCNTWRNNANNIYKTWSKKLSKYYYKIRVERNGKQILANQRNTLEEAEQVLLEFKKNNDFYFPFWANENWHLLEE